MKEEQAVLDFFAQKENLPLGLAVAEQMDAQREHLNNRLWQELSPRLCALINEHEPTWQVQLTKDKNAPDSLIGLHFTMETEQPLYLQPLMEQQYLGGVWRIYLGLIWTAAPTQDQIGLPEVASLKLSMRKSGFKSNENLFAWQWTRFHPRRKDFLLGYAQQPEKLLNDIEAVFRASVTEHRVSIEQANAALKAAPPGLPASLNQLRDELID